MRDDTVFGLAQILRRGTIGHCFQNFWKDWVIAGGQYKNWTHGLLDRETFLALFNFRNLLQEHLLNNIKETYE